MFTAIVSHTPAWVWGLLAALLALGLTQTRMRQVSRWRVLLLPLSILVMGLSSLAPTFSALPLTTLAWVAALAVGLALRLRIAPRAGTVWRADVQRLQVPGSWVPLAMIVAIFSLRYAVSVLLALHPAWQHNLVAMTSVAALYGTISGLLVGGALGLLRVVQRAPATTMLRHA